MFSKSQHAGHFLLCYMRPAKSRLLPRTCNFEGSGLCRKTDPHSCSALLAALRPWVCLLCKMQKIRLNSYGGCEVNTDDSDEEEGVIL